MRYLRDDGNCHIFHDHCVQFRTMEHISESTMEIARNIINVDSKISGSDLVRQIAEKDGGILKVYEATHIIKNTITRIAAIKPVKV